MDEPLLVFVVNLAVVEAMDAVRMANHVPASVTILTSVQKTAQLIDPLSVWWLLVPRSSGMVKSVGSM